MKLIEERIKELEKQALSHWEYTKDNDLKQESKDFWIKQAQIKEACIRELSYIRDILKVQQQYGVC